MNNTMEDAYSQDDSHGDQQPTNTKAKLSDLNKTDLIQLISHLEHEVQYRDSVINDMMNQQTKQVLYQAKYGRFGAGDPFTALQRDDQVANDQFDHNQVKSLYDNQLQQLEKLIETQRRAQAKMREQKLAADERYNKVCEELEEARRRHAEDTAQGDDVTVALEKEREKLQQDLAYEKSQLKKSEKELKRTKSQLQQQMQLSAKHKQVALDLIKERRKMVSKVGESEKKNQAIAQLLQKEQQDNQKSENSKLLQLEAKMERQLMEFDIEREQYKARIRKEESKVKDLLQQLTDIKDTVLSLQQETTADTAINDSRSLKNYLPSDSGLDYTDSGGLPDGAKVTSISLIKSITQTVSQTPSVRQLDKEIKVVTTVGSAEVKVGETIQQTARIDQGKAMSPPPKQAPPTFNKPGATGQAGNTATVDSPSKPIATILAKPINANKLPNSPQSKVTASASPKVNIQTKTPPPKAVNTAAGVTNYKPRANVAPNQTTNQSASTYILQRPNTQLNSTSPQRSPGAAGSPGISRHPVRNVSPASTVQPQPSNAQKSPSQTIKTVLRNPVNVTTSPLSSSPANIPRQIARTPVTNVNVAPQVSPKPKPATGLPSNKQSALHISTTTSNNTLGSLSATSPRSNNVPPHLGSATQTSIETNKLNAANWRNSAPVGSVGVSENLTNNKTRPVSTSLTSPTDKQLPSPGLSSSGSKAKPPPPVRNVSLPGSTNKKYQPIENTS